jgi:hypothetical protein
LCLRHLGITAGPQQDGDAVELVSGKSGRFRYYAGYVFFKLGRFEVAACVD